MLNRSIARICRTRFLLVIVFKKLGIGRWKACQLQHAASLLDAQRTISKLLLATLSNLLNFETVGTYLGGLSKIITRSSFFDLVFFHGARLLGARYKSRICLLDFWFQIEIFNFFNSSIRIPTLSALNLKLRFLIDSWSNMAKSRIAVKVEQRQQSISNLLNLPIRTRLASVLDQDLKKLFIWIIVNPCRKLVDYLHCDHIV